MKDLNSTTPACCPTGVGQDVIPPGIFPGTDGTPLWVDAANLHGIEPRATPPGIPRKRTATPPGIPRKRTALR